MADEILLQTAVINHKGLVRGNNEDNFFLNGAFMERMAIDAGACVTGECGDRFQLYAVCDGMGGADCGEEASCCAVTRLSALAGAYAQLASKGELACLLQSISEAVYGMAAEKGKRSGTTIALALVDGDRIHIANVGDSRIYRLREKKLSRLSMDHSKVQRLVALGLLTPEQARTHKDRHIISQYLGMPGDVRLSPYIALPDKVREGDVYLLCSDGLTDMVEDEQIEAIMRDPGGGEEGIPARRMARRLTEAALEKGGRDNITVMVLQVIRTAKGDKEREKRGRSRWGPLAWWRRDSENMSRSSGNGMPAGCLVKVPSEKSTR